MCHWCLFSPNNSGVYLHCLLKLRAGLPRVSNRMATLTTSRFHCTHSTTNNNTTAAGTLIMIVLSDVDIMFFTTDLQQRESFHLLQFQYGPFNPSTTITITQRINLLYIKKKINLLWGHHRQPKFFFAHHTTTSKSGRSSWPVKELKTSHNQVSIFNNLRWGKINDDDDDDVVTCCANLPEQQRWMDWLIDWWCCVSWVVADGWLNFDFLFLLLLDDRIAALNGLNCSGGTYVNLLYWQHPSRKFLLHTLVNRWHWVTLTVKNRATMQAGNSVAMQSPRITAELSVGHTIKKLHEKVFKNNKILRKRNATPHITSKTQTTFF